MRDGEEARCMQYLLHSGKFYHVELYMQGGLCGNQLLEWRECHVEFPSTCGSIATYIIQPVLFACRCTWNLSTVLAGDGDLHYRHDIINNLSCMWSEQHSEVLLPCRLWYSSVCRLSWRYSRGAYSLSSILMDSVFQIWATVLVITNLPTEFSSILYSTGIICFAIGTHYNRFSIWLYAAPVIVLLLLFAYWVCYKSFKEPITRFS